MDRKNGGTAFPYAITFGNGSWEIAEGMSLRDYFAAHALPEIPDWFRHEEPEKTYPPLPDANELDATHQEQARAWLKDPCFDLPEELSWFADKAAAHWKGKFAWEEACVAARFFQWRYHYADMMLAERERQ